MFKTGTEKKYKNSSKIGFDKTSNITNPIDGLKLQDESKNNKNILKNLIVFSIDSIIAFLSTVENMLNPSKQKSNKILKIAHEEKIYALGLIKKAQENNFQSIKDSNGNMLIECIKSEDGKIYTVKEKNKNGTYSEIDFSPENLCIYSIKKGVKKTNNGYKIKDVFKFNSEEKLLYYGNKLEFAT